MRVLTAKIFLFVGFACATSTSGSEFIDQIWEVSDEQFFKLVDSYFSSDKARATSEIAEVWQKSALPSFSRPVERTDLNELARQIENPSAFRSQLSKEASRALDLRTAIIVKYPRLFFELASGRFSSTVASEEDLINLFAVVTALDDTPDRKPRGRYWLDLYESENALYRLLAVLMSKNAWPETVDLSASETNQFAYNVLKKQEEWFNQFAGDSEEEISQLAEALAESSRLAASRLKSIDNTVKEEQPQSIATPQASQEFGSTQEGAESPEADLNNAIDNLVTAEEKNRNHAATNKEMVETSSLPMWVFIVVGVAALGILAMLLRAFLRGRAW